jgi:hypothetical protein
VIPLETEPQMQTAGRMTQDTSPREGLDALFSPSSVAVIGATDRAGTVGQTVLNLRLGLCLLSGVVQVARDEKLGRVSAEMLRDNLGMQVLSKRLGFRLRTHSDGQSVPAVLEL